MRLLIPTPQADETVTSVLDRAATAYATTREALADELVVSEGGDPDVLKRVDLDVSPPAALTGALARALGCTANVLDRLRLPKCGWLLHPGSRMAYCPECFYEDLAATGCSYMRRDWSFSFITHCSRHRRTLVSPMKLGLGPQVGGTRDLTPQSGTSDITNTWRARWTAHERWDPLTPTLRALWMRLCAFEDSLLATCVLRSERAKASAAYYRDLVVLFSANWDDVPARPAMVYLWPCYGADDLGIFDSPKNSKPQYGIYKVWQQFLARPEPVWRRSVTWMLMQCGCETGPVYVRTVRAGASAESMSLARMGVRPWIETCLAMLPDYGRWLARAMAKRWPASYRHAVYELQARPTYMGVEALNALRVEAHENFMCSLVDTVNAKDRKRLGTATMENLWRSSLRNLAVCTSQHKAVTYASVAAR